MKKEKSSKMPIIIICIVVCLLVGLFVYQKVNYKDIKDLSFEDASLKDFEYSEEDGNITLKKYKGRKSSIKIPEEFDGKKVTKLMAKEDGIFSDDIRAIYIPKTVEKISMKDGFENAKGGFFGDFIEKIEVDKDNKVYFSDNGVLYKRDKEDLSEICLLSYPRGKKDSEYKLYGDTQKIIESAFQHNVNLKKVVCNSKLEKICKNAFYECERLNEVEFTSDSVEYIGKYAFYYTDLREIKLSKNVEGIGVSVSDWEENGKKYNEKQAHSWICDSKVKFIVDKDSSAYKYAKKKEYKVETN